MRRSLPFVVLLALAISVVPDGRASAFFHEDLEALPPVWEASITEPTWVAMRLEVGGGDGDDIDLLFVHDGMATEGQWLLDADHVMEDGGGFRYASLSGAGCGSLTGATLYLSVGDVPPLVDEPGPTGCEAGISSGLGLAPGTYTIVHIVGSDGDFSGTVRAHVAENVTLLGLTSGPAFDAADAEFGGLVNGHARMFPVEAQAIVGGSVSRTIEHSLFGWFNSRGRALTHTEGPEGWEEEFPGVYFGEPPGEYVFSVDAKADAQAIFWSRVWLLAADVTLPA